MTKTYLTPLSVDEQRDAGLPESWPFALRNMVEFSELDALNHVNNAAYLYWYENIRVRYFQHVALTKYQPDDPRIVIRRGEVDYLREMVQNEDYIVTLRTESYRNTSFTVYSEVWSSGVLRSTFRGVIVLLHPDGSGRMPLPAEFLTRIQTVDGAVKAG